MLQPLLSDLPWTVKFNEC